MDAIRNVLETIRQAANQYLMNLGHRSDDWIVLSNIVDHSGQESDLTRDKVVMTVYNITHETVIASYTAAQPGTGGSFAVVQPPLYIDLHLIFMANFTDRNYAEGLAAISRTIAFFQQNPWFTHATTPQLDPVVDKVTLEFTSLDPVAVNYVMGMLGTRYLPSVFYKLRLIPFASTAMQARAYPARGTDAQGRMERLEGTAT
ncbi:MAG: DUF4255 domain-containing protein [Azospirillaceae bacterium]|nr:DUF4255 domain-containing protein [Azospirillaceae bacterium]